MPDTSELSLTGALVNATAGLTQMANGVLHLFKSSFNPTPTSTLADFLAAECDYDGYAPLTIVAWTSPPILSGVAYTIYSPTQTFLWVFDALGTGNQVGGMFYVLAGGELYRYTRFEPTLPMQGPSQAIVRTPTNVYPAG